MSRRLLVIILLVISISVLLINPVKASTELYEVIEEQDILIDNNNEVEVLNENSEIQELIDTREEQKNILEDLLSLLKKLLENLLNLFNFIDREDSSTNEIEVPNSVVTEEVNDIDLSELETEIKEYESKINEKINFYANRLNDENYIKEIEINELKGHLNLLKEEAKTNQLNYEENSVPYEMWQGVIEYIANMEEKMLK